MRLSIIVPVHNMAADNKLRFCLDSLVNQTIADYEIIAVDDASTDESFEILKEYESRYPWKFKAVQSYENRKQGGARNIGLDMAQGDWVGFVDSDDWVAYDMYEKLIKKAEETGADVVGCDYSLVHEHTFEVGQIVRNSHPDQEGELDHDRKASLILDSGSLCVKIFKRETIISQGLFFPEDIFYEDNALSNSYMLTAKRYAIVPEPLYYYYQHDDSTVHSFSTKRCEDRMEAGRIMISEAKRLGFYDEFTPELEYSFTLLFLINTLFTYMPCVKPTKLRFVKSLTTEMLAYFPEFNKNEYYLLKTGAEEQKLINMAIKSPLLFYVYYKALWAYRNLRKKP